MPGPKDETLIVILTQSSDDAGPQREGTVIVGGPWKGGQSTADLLQQHQGETFTLTTLPSALAAASTEQATLQLIIVGGVAPHQTLTIDNIRVEERTAEVPEITLIEAPDLLNMNASLLELERHQTYIPTAEQLAADSFQVKVRYQAYRYRAELGGTEPVALDLASLGDDDLCLGSDDPNATATNIATRLVNVEAGPEEHEVIATYEFVRPEAGWALYRQAWVWVCQNSIRTLDGGTALSQSLGWIALRKETEIYALNGPNVSNEDPSVLVDVRFETALVSPDDFADGDIFVRSGFERIEGIFIGAEPAPEGEPGYTATYRLDRPSVGWPPNNETIRLTSTFGNPAIATRTTRDLMAILTTDVPEDAIKVSLPPDDGPLPNSREIDPRDDRIDFEVTFTSPNGIDTTSIGDGDLLLGRHDEPGIPGRLLDLQTLPDGNTVTAAFSFPRDPRTWASHLLGFRVPTGAVSDLAGNSIRAQFAGTMRLLDTSDDDALQTGFIPLSIYHPELLSYHFRVVYQSKLGNPINLEDFDAQHLTVSQRSVDAQGSEEIQGFAVAPEVQSLRSSSDGSLVEVDYSLTRPEAGWPAYIELDLIAFGIRDVDGNSVSRGRRLASLGPSFDNQQLSAQLLAGQTVSSDAESLRISLILQAGEDFFPSDVERASLWFGWHPETLPGIEANGFSPVTGARLLSHHHIDGRWNASVATFEIDRPESGWDRWEAASIPFVFQGFAPASYHDSLSNPILLTGFVDLIGSTRILPLLSSFEDWVKQLEKEAELPQGSLRGDLDGDKQSGLLEYTLGGDPTDSTKQGRLETDVVAIEGQRYVSLTLSVRTTVIGVTVEVQQSVDGKTWRPAFSEFELVERNAISEEVEQWVLRSKQPLAGGQPGQLFRVVVAD